jgi:hypothetical protein
VALHVTSFGNRRSPWYAPSEGGRGEGSRSIGIPSPYDRNDTQGSGHVSYRHTTRRRPHRPSDEEVNAPHTTYSGSRYEGSSRDYAMSSNDRDFHAPPAVRVPSSEDAPTFRSERRRTINNAASVNGRISTTPSVLVGLCCNSCLPQLHLAVAALQVRVLRSRRVKRPYCCIPLYVS